MKILPPNFTAFFKGQKSRANFTWKTASGFLRRYCAVSAGAIIVLMCVAVLLLAVRHASPVTAPELQQFRLEQQNLAMLGQGLNNVSLKLAAIEAELKTNPAQHGLNTAVLAAQISSTRETALAASRASQSALAHEIFLLSATLQQQLITIQHQLGLLQMHNKHQAVMPASALPFTVLHIDDIQGNAVVTVRYAHTNFPLMIGDSLTGLKLVRADFVKQTAVFVNSKNQQAQIHLGSYEGAT